MELHFSCCTAIKVMICPCSVFLKADQSPMYSYRQNTGGTLKARGARHMFPPYHAGAWSVALPHVICMQVDFQSVSIRYVHLHCTPECALSI